MNKGENININSINNLLIEKRKVSMSHNNLNIPQRSYSEYKGKKWKNYWELTYLTQWV